MSRSDGQVEGALRNPRVRDELVRELAELADPDPRGSWAHARDQGHAAGVDEVFHFFFDDHDFGEGDIGVILLSHAEVVAVREVKAALQSLLDVLGDSRDDEFVSHSDWPLVAAAARRAVLRLGGGMDR